MSARGANAALPPRRPWSDEDVARLVVLCRGPATVKQIAAELGRSPSSVTGRIERLRRAGTNIPPRQRLRHPQDHARVRALWQGGRTVREISQTLGLSPRVVRARIVELRASDRIIRGLRPRRRWTAADDARLVALWQDHASAEQIASDLRRTEQAVFSRVGALRGNGVPLALRPVSRDPREDERLLELWGGPTTAVEIGAELGITHASINRRIAALRHAGVEVPDRHWSPDRQRRLREMAHRPFAEIGKELGVSPREAQDRLIAMGLIRGGDKERIEWTPEDDAQVISLWSDEKTIPEIARRIGRTTAAVNLRVNHLRRTGQNVPNRVRGKAWTDDEEKRLCDLWLEGATLAGIAHALSRSVKSVSGKVNTLRERGVDLPRRINRAPGNFTPAQFAEVEKMWRASTIEEIAQAVGCSTHTVETRVRTQRRRGHSGFPERAPRPRG